MSFIELVLNFFSHLVPQGDTYYLKLFAMVIIIFGLAGLLSPTVLHCIHILLPPHIISGMARMPMPGVRCPNCLKEDIEIWVIPGKYCPRCRTPCRRKAEESWVFLYSVIFVSITLFLIYININLNRTIEMDLDINSPVVFHQISNPLFQFKIRDFLSLNAPIFFFTRLSITNVGLYITIGTLIIQIFNYLSLNIKNIAANVWSTSKQLVYDTIYSIIINQINALKGQNYFPFIYALFLFILVHNLIGMVPYDFASTTHFISTFSMSFTVVLGSAFIGFALYKLLYFAFFVPSGCPALLLYLLVLIEFISYIARNFSLGLRLAANILSGHMLLNILSEFASKILKSMYFVLALIPYIFVVMFSALEFGIAFIQAQVFAVLSSSYIKDGLYLH